MDTQYGRFGAVVERAEKAKIAARNWMIVAGGTLVVGIGVLIGGVVYWRRRGVADAQQIAVS